MFVAELQQLLLEQRRSSTTGKLQKGGVSQRLRINQVTEHRLEPYQSCIINLLIIFRDYLSLLC